MESDDEEQEESTTRPQQSTRPSYAFIAVLSILLVAFTNPSLTGLCYLGVFFTWGTLCVTKLGSSAGRASSLAVWGAVAAISTLALIVQAAVQLLFFVGNDAWASDARTKEILELVGCPKALGVMDLFLDLFPPLFALVAASAEVNAARGASVGQQMGLMMPRLRQSMAGLASLDSTGSQAYYALMWAAGFSNAGVLAAVALAVGALLWPAVLAWPYELVLVFLLWKWSLGKEGSRASNGACRVLQTYCGAHISVLYLWQITILRASILQSPATWLGLFVISGDSYAYDLIPQVVQLAALHILFAALGFYSGMKQQSPDDDAGLAQDGGTYAPISIGSSSDRPDTAEGSGPSGPFNVQRSGLSGRRPTTSLEEFFGEDIGLLEFSSQIELAKQLREARMARQPSNGARYLDEGYQEHQPHTGHGGRPGIGTFLNVLLPLAAGATVHAVAVMSSFPSIPSVALCLFSLVEPSCLSAACLYIGLWVLLAPDAWGKHALMAMSRLLAAVFVLWHLSAYAATSIGATLALPTVAHSIGVYVFASPPPLFLPLGAQLLTAITLLGLARSSSLHAQHRRRSMSREAEVGTGTAQEPLLGQARSAPQRIHSLHTGGAAASGSFGVLLPRRLSRRSSIREDLVPGRSPRGPHLKPVADDGVSVDTVLEVGEAGPSSVADSQETFDYEMDAGSAWAVLGLSTVHAAFYLGLLLLPVGLFAVGVSEYNLLHAGYLVQLIVYFSTTARLEPSIASAVIVAPQHMFLRIYASLHLALMSAAVVSGLPAMGDRLHRFLPDDWLQSLGLWNPSVSHSIVPVLILLLMATVHTSLGNWLQLQSAMGIHLSPRRGGGQTEQGAMSFPSVLLWSSRGFVSFGSLVIVFQGYVFLLLRSNPSLLGLGYLALCIAIFLNPPLRGEFEERDEMGRAVEGPESTVTKIYRGRWSSSGHHHFITMKGGRPSRWLPLSLLAVFAAVEFATQYLFIATNFAEIAGIPDSALHFIEDVVGINTEHKGLSVRLLRSASLLGMLYLYRFGFVVGVLQAQHERDSSSPAEQERRKLHAQRGVWALAARFFILHASKLVTLTLFWAAMQRPGGFGWVLTVGLVLLSPLLGGPKATTSGRCTLMYLATLAAILVTATWMLTQYAMQVAWICDRAGPPDGLPARVVGYLGLLSCSSGHTLEYLLRVKCLVLIAITLKRRSLRWHKHLPDAVKRAGAPSSQCCLFWTPSEAELAEDSASHSLWSRIRNSALGRSVRLALKDLVKQMQDSSHRILQAMDWPATTTTNGRRSPPEPQGSSSPSQPRQPKQSPEVRETGEEASRSLLWRILDLNRWLRQLHKVKLALQDWTERFWQDWGMDITMGALLLSAFLSINILSLLYLAMIAIGMAVPAHPRRLIWRFCVLPLLSILLIAQYSFFIGPPPPFDQNGYLSSLLGGVVDGQIGWHRRRHHDSDSDAVKDWLGYGHVDYAALWALFFAFATSVVQVHYDLWHHSRLGRQYSWYHPQEESLPPSSSTTSGGQLGERSGGASCHHTNVWAPMEYEAMGTWSWIDWMRFMFYRHYTDVVLVAVVALCTLDNDVIHAAYLAIALLLFRRRDVLRTERQALFHWLPLYNFAVMLLTLLYQSPFEDIWGHSLGPSLGCNVAHVLGLYKMSGARGAAFSLTYRGALADMMLWAIFRLQTRVFSSNTYDRVMRIVAREQAEELRSREARRLRQQSEQAAAALEHSRLRKLRAMRLAQLKAGVTRQGGLLGLDAEVLDPDQEHSGWVDAMKGLLGDTSQDKGAASQQRDDSGRPRNLLRENAEQYSGRPQSGAPRKGFDWRALLRIRWRRDDKESIVCYFLFMALFVADFSGLALVFPVVLYCYALLAQPPARTFWQIMLVFTESILIAQYVYQIPSRLHCSAVTPRVRALAEEAGLHGNALRGVPIFCVYLATLMHTYSLARQKVPARELLQRRRSSITSPRGTSDAPTAQPAEDAADVEAGRQSRSVGLQMRRSTLGLPASGWAQGEPQLSDATGLVIRKWLLRLWRAAVGAVLHVWEFLRRICSSAERPLHFLKVQIGVQPGQKEYFESAAQQEVLVGTVQDILDMYRDHDIAAEFRQRELRRREASPDQTVPQAGAQLEADSGWFDAPRSRSAQLVDDAPGPSAGAAVSQQRMLPEAQAWAPSEHINLATIGPLKVALNEMLEEPHPGRVSALLEVIPLRSTPANTWGLSSVEGSPIRSLKPAKHAGLTLLRHKAATQRQAYPVPSSSGTGAAAPGGLRGQQGQPPPPLDVSVGAALQGANEGGGSKLTSFPLPDSPDQPLAGGIGRSQHSEEDLSAASTSRAEQRPTFGLVGAAWDNQDDGVRAGSAVESRGSKGVGQDMEQQGVFAGIGGSAPSGLTPGTLTIEDVEWHGRIEQDWYATTALVDLLSFIYVAVFYQAVVTSARTLADITDERVVPVDYLGVLMLLFLLLVLDRLFYTLGLHPGKAVLLWTQMVLFYWYTMVLFWSPATSTGAKLHLRILMAIKSLSFTFSALQLRNGYPPPASYRGGRGRHAFVFARHVNNFGSIAFHVFQAIPFLYELRELLDWSCTATSLTLFDWLKLEDISISLFFVTVSRQNRQRHHLGERQPRYIKFFQGTLLFLGLLLLLWVPLLVFSSGNPTYQVPEVLSFSFNATLGTACGAAAAGERGPRESVSFPLFAAGERRSQAPWAGTGSLPASMQEAYTPAQVQLLCVAEDSDRFWRVTPPARESLERMLGESDAELALSWAIVRSAPLESKHGGPLCQGTRQIALSGSTRDAILDVLQGRETRAVLESKAFPNGTAVANATAAGARGSRGLYGLFWQLRGGECSVRSDFGLQDTSAASALGHSLACDLGIQGGNITKGEEVWWRLNCTVLDTQERPVNSSGTGWSSCADTLADGPRVVAVLERVQGGIIGQTLSSFGITGLYITFVFGIGRFLRFSTQNARMRIQYEDLPTTQRLVALCQDIYIARAEGELELEEELYWALVNIYRSPAVMFELTKRKVA